MAQKTRYRIIFRKGAAFCWRCMWNGPIFKLPVRRDLLEASNLTNDILLNSLK